jgi:hypothetical protein
MADFLEEIAAYEPDILKSMRNPPKTYDLKDNELNTLTRSLEFITIRLISRLNGDDWEHPTFLNFIHERFHWVTHNNATGNTRSGFFKLVAVVSGFRIEPLSSAAKIHTVDTPSSATKMKSEQESISKAHVKAKKATVWVTVRANPAAGPQSRTPGDVIVRWKWKRRRRGWVAVGFTSCFWSPEFFVVESPTCSSKPGMIDSIDGWARASNIGLLLVTDCVG